MLLILIMPWVTMVSVTIDAITTLIVHHGGGTVDYSSPWMKRRQTG
jgi:hypothetical protein